MNVFKFATIIILVAIQMQDMLSGIYRKDTSGEA